MQEIKEYIYSLVLVGLVSGVLLSLSPARAGGGTGKYIKYALSLAVVITLLIPFVRMTDFAAAYDGEQAQSLADSLEAEYESRAAASREYIISDSLETAAANVCGSIAAKFNVAEEDVEINLRVTESDDMLTLEGLDITLGGYALLLDEDEVADYAVQTFGCECTVSYK